MNRKSMRKPFAVYACVIVGIAALALSILIGSNTSAAMLPTARMEVANAINHADESGQYSYRSTVVQTFHPTLMLSNVGRTTRTEASVVEGQVDAAAERLILNLSTANNPPLQIKFEDGQGYGRLSDTEEWVRG